MDDYTGRAVQRRSAVQRGESEGEIYETAGIARAARVAGTKKSRNSGAAAARRPPSGSQSLKSQIFRAKREGGPALRNSGHGLVASVEGEKRKT